MEEARGLVLRDKKKLITKRIVQKKSRLKFKKLGGSTGPQDSELRVTPQKEVVVSIKQFGKGFGQGKAPAKMSGGKIGGFGVAGDKSPRLKKDKAGKEKTPVSGDEGRGSKLSRGSKGTKGGLDGADKSSSGFEAKLMEMERDNQMMFGEPVDGGRESIPYSVAATRREFDSNHRSGNDFDVFLEFEPGQRNEVIPSTRRNLLMTTNRSPHNLMTKRSPESQFNSKKVEVEKLSQEPEISAKASHTFNPLPKPPKKTTKKAKDPSYSHHNPFIGCSDYQIPKKPTKKVITPVYRSKVSQHLKEQSQNQKTMLSTMSRFGGSRFRHVDNFRVKVLDPKNILFTRVIDTFFFSEISGNQKDCLTLHLSYLSFLFFEMGNYLSTMTQAYDYLYSSSFETNGSWKAFVLFHNYIKMATYKIHMEFVKSEGWLSKDRLYAIYEYLDKLDNAEEDFYALMKNRMDFYYEMCQEYISYDKLINTGHEIFSKQIKMEKNLKRLLDVSPYNVRLLCLDSNFKLNFLEFPTEKIRKHIELYRLTKQQDPDQEIRKQSKFFNLYHQKNMILFANILENKFTISKFTSNTPDFFEMEATELLGRKISDLMPLDIAKKHDGYVYDYINKRDKNLTQTPTTITFGVTKLNHLRVINLLIKIEYFMVDDVYICAMLVPHRKNKSPVMLLSEEGFPICQNEKSSLIFGPTAMDYPYSVYMLMPGLLDLIKRKRDLGSKKDVFMKDEHIKSLNGSVVDFREAHLFFYGNLNAAYILNKLCFRCSEGQQLRLVSGNPKKDRATLVGFLKAVMSEFKRDFIIDMDQIRRVSIHMEKYSFKRNVNLLLLDVKGLKMPKNHHVKYMRMLQKTILTKNFHYMMMDPDDLSKVCKLKNSIFSIF